MAGRRLAGGAAGGSFLSRSVFFLRRGEGGVIQAEPRLTAESEMSWEIKVTSWLWTSHLQGRSTSGWDLHPTPHPTPPTPRLSFSAGGAQPPAPSNTQTSTYTKGALKHLTVVFDFLGLKHPPGSPGGWWQVIRLNRSDNKAIWNLIQQELVDKSQHFEALDAPHQLDLLPLRDW